MISMDALYGSLFLGTVRKPARSLREKNTLFEHYAPGSFRKHCHVSLPPAGSRPPLERARSEAWALKTTCHYRYAAAGLHVPNMRLVCNDISDT